MSAAPATAELVPETIDVSTDRPTMKEVEASAGSIRRSCMLHVAEVEMRGLATIGVVWLALSGVAAAKGKTAIVQLPKPTPKVGDTITKTLTFEFAIKLTADKKTPSDLSYKLDSQKTYEILEVDAHGVITKAKLSYARHDPTDSRHAKSATLKSTSFLLSRASTDEHTTITNGDGSTVDRDDLITVSGEENLVGNSDLMGDFLAAHSLEQGKSVAVPGETLSAWFNGGAKTLAAKVGSITLQRITADEAELAIDFTLEGEDMGGTMTISVHATMVVDRKTGVAKSMVYTGPVTLKGTKIAGTGQITQKETETYVSKKTK